MECKGTPDAKDCSTRKRSIASEASTSPESFFMEPSVRYCDAAEHELDSPS